MLIVSVDMFVYVRGVYYCKPYSFTSLSQFWELDDKSTLLGIEHIHDSIPKGWVAIPANIKCLDIKNICSKKALKRKKNEELVRLAVDNEKVAYIRMPDYRVYRVYKLIKGAIPFFCEFHGDWEEALLAQKYNNKGIKNNIKMLVAPLRAAQAKKRYFELAKESLANISIGPALVSKYELNVKPFLTTTNHIVSQKDIITNFSKQKYKEVYEFIYIGELQHRKGLNFLLEAIKLIKTNSKIKFRLQIVGEGYQKEELIDYCKVLDLDDCVDFCGAIYDRNLLDQKLIEADVFILPSIAAEGVPRVLQEAQSKGCAIIATDIGGTYWQLENNSGFLIRPKSSDEIHINLLKLCDGNELLAEMKITAIKQANLFSYEKQKNGIQSFLLENLGKYFDRV